MKYFQSKNGVYSLYRSKLLLSLLVVVLLFFSFKIFDFANKAKIASENKDLAQDRLVELEQSKEKLQKEIESLKTEKGIEKSIRDKFGFAKEGEQLIMVIEEKQNKEIDESNSNGIWNTIKNWLD